MNTDVLGALIDTLRGENGCPWDKQQTPKTVLPYLIEETYELLDAIASAKVDRIREELGDVLFQVHFLVRLYREKGCFTLDDVTAGIVEKMVRRHPHVFGDRDIGTPEEVKKQWHEIKRKEKKDSPAVSALDSIPVTLPALMRAYRISDRAASTGFDWEDMSDVLSKVEEEWGEFRAALSTAGPAAANDEETALEYGDILFTLVNVARFARIHPETALTGSIKKFEKRFRHMERTLSAEGRAMDSVSYDELNRRWEKAKEETEAH